MVSIEIDGIKTEASLGTMIIQVADALGIHIPRFCYHQKLSIAANCRMCLVEVSNALKPMPACATPVVEGMKIFTASHKAREAQRAVMEFLLINHPLDCPICDQGGECELQDVSLEYGGGVSRYQEPKRVVQDKDIGPLIATEMTRCIHCTRCVRFGTELAGVRELGATGRGEHMEIGTFLAKSVDSELSGNIIDLCPVGALTSKPYRFTARSWELHQHAGIASHDCVGSQVYFHVASGKVKRTVPKPCEDINEIWLSDRDRFGYLGIESQDRLLNPKIRDNGGWVETDWETAFRFLKERLGSIPSQEIGGLISPASTLEACFLFQKFLKQLGTDHVDHRVYQLDFAEDTLSSHLLGMPLAELENLERILLIGAYPRKEQPLLNHRIRKACLKGAEVIAINPIAYPFNFPIQQIVPEAGLLQTALMRFAKAISEEFQLTEQNVELASVVPTTLERDAAHIFLKTSKKAIFLGPEALHHPNASILKRWASWIAKNTAAAMGELPIGPNSAGARLAGAIPTSQKGFHAYQMLENPLKAYCLFNLEPEFDSVDPARFYAALKQAGLVIGITSYTSPYLEECAHVLLPLATVCETSGTYINIEGKWQSFRPAIPPLGNARPGWKILCALGTWFEQSGFSYQTSEAVRDELQIKKEACFSLPPFEKGGTGGILETTSGDIWVSERGMYTVDGMLRRANALQQTEDARLSRLVRVNANTAKKYGLTTGETVVVQSKIGKAEVTLKIDPAIPDRVVYIAQGNAKTLSLGAPYQPVTLHKQEVEHVS